MPISESNYFVYDKYNYGVALNNVSGPLFQKSNGELICSEYSGFINKINNSTIQKSLPNLKSKNPILEEYIKLKNGIEYYCCSHEIISLKNKKRIKRIKINSQNDFSFNFSVFNDTIYYATYFNNKKLIIRKFDGKKSVNIISIKTDSLRYNIKMFVNHQINVIDYYDDEIAISKLVGNKLILIKKYPINDATFSINYFKDVNNFSGYTSSKKNFICTNGKIVYFDYNTSLYPSSFHSSYYHNMLGRNKNVYKLTPTGNNYLFNTTNNSGQFTVKNNNATNSYFAGTNTSFLRYFPHIKKYPRLFNDSNSSSVFSLLQANDGKIWAGSYQGHLTTIDKNSCKQSSINEFMFMNGGMAIKDKLLLFSESEEGALLFTDINNYTKIVDKGTFFYAYKSKNNKIYLGSSGKGLWFTNISNLDKPQPIKWNRIDDKKGLKLYNIITICEDKFGNIWTGRSSQGIAVYNPETNKTKTWLLDNNEIDFGSMSTVLDNKNTLWFGKNDGGLCYYDGKSAIDFDVKNFKTINHPLLKNDLGITFIKQWKNYLILGAKDKILLFDVQKWHETKKVLVRYLNAQETNFSTPTEQNTCLIDKRDESVWFTTGDMVYQWDIKKWLTLPTFKVIPSIVFKKDSTETEFTTNKIIEFEPTENSFDIQINYQTKDNMPRFINGILVKKGEKPVFETPNLETKFQFKNLSAGEYVFYVRVCQQDGSFDVFKFPLCVDTFFWQKWWFWASVFMLKIGILIYFFQKRNQIEKQKKRLSQLNLSSLSNQFRPHFMLNALNSIGSQMQDKPHAEKVISRLGESINILYGFTKKNDFTISFLNEWKLVENSIEIQRLLFIPELNLKIDNRDVIPDNYKIPVGILQIPIENALLHGLRNKTDGNCNLEIDFLSDENHYCIVIKDNGVGREKAAKINNFKKNGTGLKTIFEMIQIINQHEKKSILFEIIDLKELTGTMVKISLNKIIDYDKIKL